MKIPSFAVAVWLCSVLIPQAVTGQTPDAARSGLDRFTFQVAAGPLLNSGGHTLSAGFGFSPLSRLDFLVNVERDLLPFERDMFDGGYSITRGGTLTTVSGEVRASVLPPHRASPYAFAGVGGGVSRPTVNDAFPEPVKHDLQVVYFGGGLRVPIRRNLTIFGDVRAMLAVDGGDGVQGIVPVRIGLAWRF